MARRLVLALVGSASAVLGGCASEAPAPLRLARLDALTPPPVPSELLGPTNGKADSPFQLDTAFVLAAQSQMAARRAASQPAMAVAVAAPAPSKPTVAAAAPVRLARASAPVSPARASAPSSKSALHAAPIVVAVATPPAPIAYVELVRNSLGSSPAAASVSTGEALARVDAAPVRVARAAVRTRRARPSFARRMTIAAEPRALAPVSQDAPRRVVRASLNSASQTGIDSRRATATPTLVHRVRDILGEWISALRS